LVLENSLRDHALLQKNFLAGVYPPKKTGTMERNGVFLNVIRYLHRSSPKNKMERLERTLERTWLGLRDR
jgi:hypothetical protein